MSNAIFPTFPGLAWGVVKAPQFTTRIQRAASGRELRASLTAYPTYTIRLSFEFLRADEFQQLLGFFLARRGAWDSFLFTDPDDCQVTDYRIAAGDGNRNLFQLLRPCGGFIEPVENVNTITEVKVGGVAKIQGKDYTVTPSGILVFNPAPGPGQDVTWTGSYYYRCRFKDDSADFSKFMQQLWEFKKCELVGATGNKV